MPGLSGRLPSGWPPWPHPASVSARQWDALGQRRGCGSLKPCTAGGQAPALLPLAGCWRAPRPCPSADKSVRQRPARTCPRPKVLPLCDHVRGQATAPSGQWTWGFSVSSTAVGAGSSPCPTSWGCPVRCGITATPLTSPHSMTAAPQVTIKNVSRCPRGAGVGCG